MEAIAKPEIKVHDKLYINGQWVTPGGAGMIDVINSTTEEVMGSVPEGSSEDVDAAVAAAKAAFEKWSTTNTCPVTNEDSSEARYNAIPPISSGRPTRGSGCLVSSCLT